MSTLTFWRWQLQHHLRYRQGFRQDFRHRRCRLSRCRLTTRPSHQRRFYAIDQIGLKTKQIFWKQIRRKIKPAVVAEQSIRVCKFKTRVWILLGTGKNVMDSSLWYSLVHADIKCYRRLEIGMLDLIIMGYKLTINVSSYLQKYNIV